METLKMIWRTTLFLGAVTVVFVAYTVGVALVERHFSPKYAKKNGQAAPVAEATAPQSENTVRAMLDSGQLNKENSGPALQNQGQTAPADQAAGLMAGAAVQSGQ